MQKKPTLCELQLVQLYAKVQMFDALGDHLLNFQRIHLMDVGLKKLAEWCARGTTNKQKWLFLLYSLFGSVSLFLLL